MKLRFLILIMFLAVIAQPAASQQVNAPLGKDQVMDLVKAGMETPELVKLIHEHGIDFDLSTDYLQALRQAGAQDAVIQALRAARPKPLTKEQVLQLLAGHVPSERAAALVKQHGIDFLADERYLATLRLAGADDTLIAAVREASAAVRGDLMVATSPNAEVYLDGALQGRADAQGQLAVKAKPGDHALKVSLKGKKDSEQNVTLAARQTTKIEARLEDVAPSPGAVRENPNPNFSTEAPTILSDTRGVDFGPYLDRIVYIVRRNWLAVIPESARRGEKGRVGVVFEILKDGSVPQLRLVASSGSDPLDRAAVSSIHASVPFPPLPQEFNGNHLVLQSIFLYNLTPQ
jgi:TonB family protein